MTTPTLTIRLVVGGNAILDAGHQQVNVYAETDRDPAEVILPPERLWNAHVADDFPFSYADVTRAVEGAGHRVVVDPNAAIASSTKRGT